jgi:hypothetical protein
VAINLNGTTQYLERTATVGASFPLTISAWFKTNSTTTAQVIWSESSTTGQSRHSFYIDTDSKLKCATVDTGGVLYTAASTNSITTGWQHGAAYFASNSDRTIYLNAAGINTTTSPAPTVGSRNRTNIGCRYGGTTTPAVYFNGNIAELCIWTVQLTQGEITALANGAHPLSIRPASILTYYPLGGFFGNSGNDFSSGGRNMTSVGTPTYEDHPSIYYPQPIYFAPEGASAQSITLDVISAATTVYQPSITPGPLDISLSNIAATTTVYEPTVTALPINIVLPVIAATTTVHQPSISVGAVNIAAPLIAATTTVYQPQLNTSVSVALNAISATTTVYGPTVAPGAVNISAPEIAATTSVNGPVITLGTGIVLDAIPADTTINGPQITAGPVDIAAPLIAATTTIHEPTVVIGAVNITLPAIPSATVVYNPAVELMLQIISLNVIGPNTVVRQPDISGQSTDTRDVLPGKSRKRRQSIREQLEEENVAAQILRARQLEEQRRLEEEAQAQAAAAVIEETQEEAPILSFTAEQQTDVQQALVAYEARQVRNKRLKTLLLMAAMED